MTLEPVELPKPAPQLVKTDPETLAEIDRLLETHRDEGVAQELNAMGLRNWKGERFTGKRVGGIRRRHGLSSHVERQIKRLRKKGFGTAWEVAAQLGMNERVVRRLGKAGDPRVERVIVPIQSRRRYCMYRANPAALPAPSSGD